MSKYDTGYDRDPLGSLTPWRKNQPEPGEGATVATAYADFDLTADISEDAQIAHNLAERERLAAEAQADEEEAARYPILMPEDSWTPEQIKQVVLADERQQREHQQNATAELTGRRFQTEEPRYIASDANGAKLVEWIYARYGEVDALPNLPDVLHEAFNDLVAKGEMQTKAVAPAPRRKYTAEELDSMPFDDLRELSNDTARFTVEPEVPRWVRNPNRSRV